MRVQAVAVDRHRPAARAARTSRGSRRSPVARDHFAAPDHGALADAPPARGGTRLRSPSPAARRPSAGRRPRRRSPGRRRSRSRPRGRRCRRRPRRRDSPRRRSAARTAAGAGERVEARTPAYGPRRAVAVADERVHRVDRRTVKSSRSPVRASSATMPSAVGGEQPVARRARDDLPASAAAGGRPGRATRPRAGGRCPLRNAPSTVVKTPPTYQPPAPSAITAATCSGFGLRVPHGVRGAGR